MRRATLATTSIKTNKGKSVGKEVRPRSSFGVGPRTSGAGVRPKTSFGSTRRSSQYGRGDPRTQNKDPRPLSEKSYQQKQIKDILQFLSENDYQHPISVKTMMIPTSKEFLRVFSFLYSHIEPNQTYKTLMAKKPEEEVPKILKSLGYPYTIHKTSLGSVVSPHAWPVLLGALHWLMDVVKFAMAITDEIQECPFLVVGGDVDDDAAESRVYFEYLEKSYEAFIVEGRELENLGEYRDALLDELRSGNAPIIAENEPLARENQKMDKAIAQLQNEPSKVQTKMEEKETLESDKAKFEKYIVDLQRHRVKLEERRIQSEEALEFAKLEYEATSGEKMKRQKILDNQELSAADVQRMKQKGEELRKTLSKLEETSDSLDQEIWEKEMNYVRKHEQVLAQCQDYNERARKLKLIPSTAENAAGMDYELKCHLGRMTLDIKDHLKPSLLRFKQQITKCCCQCESELINLKNKHDLMEEQISENEEGAKLLEAKIDSFEKEIQWKKQQYDEEQKKLSDEVDEMQNKVDQLRLALQNQQTDVSEKRNQLQEAKERVKKKVDEMNHETTQYEIFLRAVIDLVIDHKTVIQNSIKEVKNDMQMFEDCIRNIPPVTSDLISKEDIERILAEDDKQTPPGNLATKPEDLANQVEKDVAKETEEERTKEMEEDSEEKAKIALGKKNTKGLSKESLPNDENQEYGEAALSSC